MKHRDIQPAHEESVLKSFGQYLHRQGVNLKVIARPDPPDAIVEIDNEKCWIEITDAFQSSDWARSITSYAADDNVHQPYQSRLIYEPDQAAYEKVRDVISKKLKKTSMSRVSHQHGQGILLVGCYTPLTTPQEIVDLARASIIEELSGGTKIFKSIYLYVNDSNGHAFTQLM